MNHKHKIVTDNNVYTFVGISILFFLFKGIRYLIIGSYFPFLFIIFAAGLLSLSLYLDYKKQILALQIWSLFLILWSVVRFILWLVLLFDENLTEAHLRGQFVMVQHLTTVLIGFIGFWLLSTLKKLKRQYFLISNK